jgi:hypothetical protein
MATEQLQPDLIYVTQLGTPDSPDPGNPGYDWHFLAEGDSWFSIGAIPSSNLLYELRLAKWTQILNLATPGDTLKHMSDIVHNADLYRYLARRNFCFKWDAILLSAGGNDLIDAAGAGLISCIPAAGKDPADPWSYIDRPELDALVARVQAGYAEIVALRDSPGSLSRGRPIIVHTYDYPTPRNAPAHFFVAPIRGPWLYRIFNGKSIGLQLQRDITNTMYSHFAEGLLALDSHATRPDKRLANVHVVRTCSRLIPANPADIGASNDWLNEIHPTAGGYRKIGAALSARLAEVL